MIRLALLALYLYIASKKGKGGKLLATLKGAISSVFGPRVSPHTGQPSFHNGVDIAVPVGTPIIAPAAGTIKSIFTTATGGLQMIVTHDNGNESGYAHLSRVLFGPGVPVPAAKVIAESGASGNVTGPHLHFTWKKDGEYLNPQDYFTF